MSNNRLLFEGLNELRAQLQALPDELAEQAGAVVIAHAEKAKRDIESSYPKGPTGNLRSRVTIERKLARAQTSATVRSKAPHANIFERGTARRVTNRGWNRGRMPEAPVSQRMIPKAIHERSDMVEDLKDVVRRAGLEVSE